MLKLKHYTLQIPTQTELNKADYHTFSDTWSKL